MLERSNPKSGMDVVENECLCRCAVAPQSQEIATMNIYMLTVSSISLAVGVLFALDAVVLVSGVSGIMFCWSIIADSFENPDPRW